MVREGLEQVQDKEREVGMYWHTCHVDNNDDDDDDDDDDGLDVYVLN